MLDDRVNQRLVHDLEDIEQTSKKAKRKWGKTLMISRKSYVTQAMAALKIHNAKAYYGIYKDTKML